MSDRHEELARENRYLLRSVGGRELGPEESIVVMSALLRRVAEETQQGSVSEEWKGRALDAEQRWRHSQLELSAAREQVRRLTEAADWVLHVAHGVGKAGEGPEPGEYEASMDALEAEAFPERVTARVALAETDEEQTSQVVLDGQRESEQAVIEELVTSLRAVVNNHCSNPRLFCTTCTHARELLARVEEHR